MSIFSKREFRPAWSAPERSQPQNLRPQLKRRALKSHHFLDFWIIFGWPRGVWMTWLTKKGKSSDPELLKHNKYLNSSFWNSQFRIEHNILTLMVNEQATIKQGLGLEPAVYRFVVNTLITELSKLCENNSKYHRITDDNTKLVLCKWKVHAFFAEWPERCWGVQARFKVRHMKIFDESNRCWLALSWKQLFQHVINTLIVFGKIIDNEICPEWNYWKYCRNYHNFLSHKCVEIIATYCNTFWQVGNIAIFNPEMNTTIINLKEKNHGKNWNFFYEFLGTWNRAIQEGFFEKGGGCRGQVHELVWA